jgi:ParB family chromosome partitioning protein
LAASIKEQGIIQPITVRKMGYDKYQLISGERRLKASKIAGLDEIPSYIRIANDQQMLEMALVENIQRGEPERARNRHELPETDR